MHGSRIKAGIGQKKTHWRRKDKIEFNYPKAEPMPSMEAAVSSTVLLTLSATSPRNAIIMIL